MCASSRSGESVWALIPAGLKQGANRRLAGEDAQAGAVLLEAGARLQAARRGERRRDAGSSRLSCYAPLKVAILSTGDEILRPGERFRAGQGL